MTTPLDSRLAETFDNLSTCVGVKDPDSKFIYINRPCCALYGFDKPEDAIGLTEEEVPCESLRQNAQLFRERDLHVMNTRKGIKTLEIHPFAHDLWQIFLVSKEPFVNPQTDTLLGVAFMGHNMSDVSYLEASAIVDKMHFKKVKPKSIKSLDDLTKNMKKMEDIVLDDIEAQVLFYTMRGIVPRNIKMITGIPEKEVKKTIFLLQEKFGVKSTMDLIDDAALIGFAKVIPEAVCRKPLSLVVMS